MIQFILENGDKIEIEVTKVYYQYWEQDLKRVDNDVFVTPKTILVDIFQGEKITLTQGKGEMGTAKTSIIKSIENVEKR